QAEYMPQGSTGAIGDAKTEIIRFSLPREVFLGDLRDAQFQIAVGCQDDHGGAGIGDFREVKAQVGGWVGGGKLDPDGSNVYDWLISEKAGE
ncbi:MAG: hypothetical protein L3J79_05040, partial [Candidatus Marinimicrobia bacterium]|nr:hypothetical protein [Candidatus Neomarinimicrobiota bacterium]